MTFKVFICYRRDTAAGHAGRVHDRLLGEFGRDLLFMDVDSIPLGANFVEVLNQEVAKCDALLAIIGPGWLDSRDEHGNRRLDDPHDFVRIEIGTALKRGIPVVPILLEGTRAPTTDQLPNELKELSLRQGLDVRHTSFTNDMERLIRWLKGEQSSGLRVSSTAILAEPNKKAEIDRSLKHVEADNIADYQPQFLSADQEPPYGPAAQHPGPTAPRAEVDALARNWRLVLWRGVTSILCGLVGFVSINTDVESAGALFRLSFILQLISTFVLVDGVIALAYALYGSASLVSTWWLVVVGVTGITVGIISFFAISFFKWALVGVPTARPLGAGAHHF